MIVSIAITLLGLIAAGIALMLLKDVLWFVRSLKYIKQGIPVRYYPFLGYNKHMDNPNNENGLADFMKLFENPKKKNKTEDVILVNGFTTPLIFINHKDLVKEYHQRETEVTHLQNMFKFPAPNTFVFSKDMHRIKNARSIFSEIFYPVNLRKQTPQLKAIAQRHFNRIRDEVKKAQAQGKQLPEIELKRFMKVIFADSVSYVLFGGEFPEVDGQPLVNHIGSLSSAYFANSISSLNAITMGLSTKLGLDPEFNKAKQLMERVIQKIKQVVIERENNKNYQFGCNTVDLLILKNRELEAQGKTELVMNREQIANNIFAMIFAGMDTSKNFTEACFFKLSHDQALQEQLRQSVRKEILDTGNGEVYDKYVQSELLENLIKESLRLWTPAAMSFHRRIVKTFKLGPYTLHKGDLVILSLTTLMTKPEVWKKPMQFDLEKYKDKKRIKDLSRSAYVPFSAGKRSCIGKNLAEIMVRLILSNFVDQFELQKSEEPNRRYMAMAMALKHCKARLLLLK